MAKFKHRALDGENYPSRVFPKDYACMSVWPCVRKCACVGERKVRCINELKMINYVAAHH